MPLARLGAGPSANPSGYLVQDTLTDSNGTVLTSHTPDVDSVGNGWQAGAGTFKITSNHVYLDSGIGTVNNNLIDTGAADHSLAFDVTTGTSTTGWGVNFRASASNDNLEAYLYPPDGKVYFVKNDGGSRSVLTSAATGAAASTTYDLDVVTSGTSVVISVDDTPRIDTTESHNQTDTSVGPWIFGAYSDGYWDNLTVVE
jgi:hypothetical protein